MAGAMVWRETSFILGELLPPALLPIPGEAPALAFWREPNVAARGR